MVKVRLNQRGRPFRVTLITRHNELKMAASEFVPTFVRNRHVAMQRKIKRKKEKKEGKEKNHLISEINTTGGNELRYVF